MIKCNSLSEAAYHVDQYFNTGELVQDRVHNTFDCIPPHVPITLVDSDDECYKLSYRGTRYKKPNHFSYQMMYNRLMTDVVVGGEHYTAAHFQFGREGDLKSILGDLVSAERKAKMRAWYDNNQDRAQAMNHHKVVQYQTDPEYRDSVNRSHREWYNTMKVEDPDRFREMRDHLTKLSNDYKHKMKLEDPEKYESVKERMRSMYWSKYRPMKLSRSNK